MTTFSKSKAAMIEGLDQSLLYALIALERANRAYDNSEWLRDITVDQAAQNNVNFSVTKDNGGIGRISFSAVLSFVNRNPFKAKNNFIDHIGQFTNYYSDLIDDIPTPIETEGVRLPATLPNNIHTLEQYLAYLAMLANNYREWVIRRNANQSIDSPGLFTSGGNPIDYPLDISSMGGASGEGETSEGWQHIYTQLPPNYDLPDWYRSTLIANQATYIVGSGGSDGLPGGGAADNPVQSLAVCAEQDPEATSYSNTGNDILDKILNSK